MECPEIGYTQSMNYVAAVALLILQEEDDAFYLLMAITKNILPDYHTFTLSKFMEVLGASFNSKNKYNHLI